jgi:hypothetical protein
MASVKYDVRGVEPGRDYDEPIPKGVYKVKILSCLLTKSSKKNDMFELELEVVKGEHKGRRLWDYVTLTEEAKWKLSGLVHALGLKEKGSIDPESLQGKTLAIKVKHETYTTEDDEGNEITKITSKVGSMLPKKEEEAEDEEEPDEEEEETEDEDEDEEEEDEEEDEDEEYTLEEIQEANKAELKEIISEEELGIRVTKKTKLADLRDKVAEALELNEEEEEEEEPEEEDEGEDYSEMSLKELRKELKERELSTSGKKAALIKRLEKDDESGDEDGDDEEPF